MTRGRFGRSGELIPARGFSRAPLPAPSGSWWTSHDWLRVCSTLEHSILPGTDDEVGPQWHLSVSKAPPRTGPSRADRPTDADMARVIEAFGVPGGEEDNHHPGIARHLWCPVDEQYRSTCECKLSEATVVEHDGYRWTTEDGEECRGCEYGEQFEVTAEHVALKWGGRTDGSVFVCGFCFHRFEVGDRARWVEVIAPILNRWGGR